MTEGRPPQSLTEHVVANLRPQPAIPAVLAMFAMVLLPAMLAQPQTGGPGAVLIGIVTAGVIASCGLAVAAGFCSLVPHLIWLALCPWALSLLSRGGLPGWVAGLVYAGAVAVLVMFVVQLWRIRTGRFVPTIHAPPA